MRFRPLIAALVVVLAAAIGFLAAAATAPARQSAPEGPMPPALAKGLAQDVKDAIADEHAALRSLSHLPTFAKEISKSRSKLEFVAGGSSAHGDLDAYADARDALKDDEAALNEARSPGGDDAVIRKHIASALRSKAAAYKNLNAIAHPGTTAPPTPTTPPAPPAGPLEACVSVTNNGTSSDENVTIFDRGAKGASGTVNFNGQGVNQTKPFTFPSTESEVVSFPVTVFGAAIITIDVTLLNGQVQALSFGFTLMQSNDGTGPCTPSTNPPGN